MKAHARTRSILSTLTCAMLITAHPASAFAGPPWISIELPANPLDPTTRGAFLVVHTYHHAKVVTFPVTGRAIGIVGGKRQTIDLTFTRTSVPGAYALNRSWPATGAWVLVINTGGNEGGPTALVTIGTDGEVRSVKVPRQSANQQWGRPITDRDIDAALQAA